LRRCIQEDSFVVVYQPIYDVKEQAYTKAEALLRLPPHDLGQLGPDEFIPLAEENGLITEITYQVLRPVYFCSSCSIQTQRCKASASISLPSCFYSRILEAISCKS